MTLVIRREQVLGVKFRQGAMFRFFAKLELTEEEKQLVERYKVDERTWVELGGDKVSIASLGKGVSKESEHFGFITSWESNVHKGCREMKEQLDALSSFTGVTTIDL
jgi:hypothetical protein